MTRVLKRFWGLMGEEALVMEVTLSPGSQRALLVSKTKRRGTSGALCLP